jgi:hypothetical protein
MTESGEKLMQCPLLLKVLGEQCPLGGKFNGKLNIRGENCTGSAHA